MLFSGERTQSADLPFFEEFYEANRKIRIFRRVGRSALSEAYTDSLDARLYDELASGIIEALAGDFISTYTFDVVDGEPIAKNGETLFSMMNRSRGIAVLEYDRDNRLGFMVDRFNAELDEVIDQRKIIASHEHNTLITFSPFTEELLDQPGLLKRAMQDPHRRRSMIRISHWDGSKLHITTAPFDFSSLEGIAYIAREVFSHRFSSNASIEMLRDRRYVRMDMQQVKQKIQQAKELYASIAPAVTPTGNRKDLHAFVYSRPDILNELVKRTREISVNATSYDNFKKQLDAEIYNFISLYDMALNDESLLDTEDLTLSAQDAGNEMRSVGQSYDLCGYVVSPETPDLGYESLMYLSNRLVRCPNQSCKKMVIIDDSFLKQGILHCRECMATVDVCGDKAKAKNIQKIERDKQLKKLKKSTKQNKIQNKGQTRKNPDSIFAGFLY